jgi:hypothetical protein
MNHDTLTKSPNQVPLHTDWARYETPAVVRKHGRQFLERFWTPQKGEPRALSFEEIAKSYGARIEEFEDVALLFFEDADQAAACARKLRETGEALSIAVQLSVQRKGRPGAPRTTVCDGRAV